MKKEDDSIFDKSLDNILMSPSRMPIVVLLAMYEEADFTFIKGELAMSDGNLGANLKKLEDEHYITSRKIFVSRKPKSIYRITPEGLRRLKGYIETMKGIGRALDSKSNI